MTTMPLTPLPGTGDPNPLVQYARYQSITGDLTSDEADVNEAIADAVEMVCNECRRTLLYGQYNENQFLYKMGMVFPSATPIDPTMPISSGNNEIFDPIVDNAPGSIIQGQGVWVGWFSPLPWMPVFSGVLPPQTNVEYWGGYTYQTIPPKLARAIAKIAYYSLHPYALSTTPGGVKSMSVGGVSISGDLYSFMLSDPQLKRDIRRFRHPQTRAWQS